MCARRRAVSGGHHPAPNSTTTFPRHAYLFALFFGIRLYPFLVHVFRFSQGSHRHFIARTTPRFTWLMRFALCTSGTMAGLRWAPKHRRVRRWR